MRPQRQNYPTNEQYQDISLLYLTLDSLRKRVSDLEAKLGIQSESRNGGQQGISRAVNIPAASDPNAQAQVSAQGIIPAVPSLSSISISGGSTGYAFGTSPSFTMAVSSAATARSAIGAAASGTNTDITSLASGVAVSGGAKVLSGTGTPEGAVTAPVGSVFFRTDGGATTTLYVKESGSGNTGWVAK